VLCLEHQGRNHHGKANAGLYHGSTVQRQRGRQRARGKAIGEEVGRTTIAHSSDGEITCSCGGRSKLQHQVICRHGDARAIRSAIESHLERIWAFQSDHHGRFTINTGRLTFIHSKGQLSKSCALGGDNFTGAILVLKDILTHCANVGNRLNGLSGSSGNRR